MKRWLLITIILLIALVTAALLWWPLPPERESTQRLARASLTVNLTPDLLQPTTSRGLLSWLGIRGPSTLRRPEVGTTLANVASTGFASSPYQTDASPCRTAAGNIVRPGTVASNFLPLGTLLKITVDGRELPGTFIVEDRMADRFSNRIDIWFAQTSQALDFGKRHVEIMVIGYGKAGQPLAQVETAEEIAAVPERTILETIKLRARAIAEFLVTRGVGVNRFDVDCLALQEAALDL